ncbi:MAG: MBOAT family O-acyltransferase [Prosthecobacter sp.]
MLFHSFEFWIFFALVFVLHWRAGPARQNLILLVASAAFYGWWNWRFLAVLALSILVSYRCAIGIQDATQPRGRKRWMLLAALWHAATLFYFKYYGWMAVEMASALKSLGLGEPGWVVKIAAPVGISFFTFTQLTYLLDVYREKSEATRRFWDYALYVSFFPHIMAGPISRQDRLQPQFEEPRPWLDEERFRSGLYLIMTGLFRKVVVADNLAVIANHVYNRPAGEVTFPEFILGTYAFAFQVYGDFSGYSCMAQGIAKWLGIDLMANFRQPYLAENPSDFWRRWHISLSSALRDYIFIPLSMASPSIAATCRNMLVVMMLAGLWHGANWTFVAWGAFHGAWLSWEVWSRHRAGGSPPAATGWRRTWRILATFHMVCLSYVFFRADSMADAWGLFSTVAGSWAWTHFTSFGLAYGAFFVLPLLLLDWWNERERDPETLTSKPWPWRAVVYAAIVLLMLFFAPPSANEFVYFRF